MQFDDPDDDEDAHVVLDQPSMITKNPSSNEALVAASSISDPQTSAPEEVRSSNEEILRLKQLHEDMMHTVRSNVKRRTPSMRLSSSSKESTSTLNRGDEDAAVDTSFIEAERVDEEISGLPSPNTDIVQGGRLDKPSKAGRRGRGGVKTIDAHRSNPTSKKFDGLEVVVLAAAATHDLAKRMHPIDHYQLSSAVLSFSSHQHSKNPRVKYSSFVSQKKQKQQQLAARTAAGGGFTAIAIR